MCIDFIPRNYKSQQKHNIDNPKKNLNNYTILTINQGAIMSSNTIGFKTFTSLWNDAYDQISKEFLASVMDDDIKLFTILRNVVLYPDKITFIRSYKLTDFNGIIPKMRATLDTPYSKRAHVSWNHIPQPYGPSLASKPRKKNAPNTPAPISCLHAGNTKIICHKTQIKIDDNDCVFEPTECCDPNEKLYTVVDNDFIAKLDSTCVLYPVSSRIMQMFATNAKSCINLKFFQESTEIMRKNLLTKRSKMK